MPLFRIYLSLVLIIAATFWASSAEGSDLRRPMEEIRKRIWFNTYGNLLQLHNDESAQSFDTDMFGFSVGMDRRWGAFAQIGGGVAWDWTSVEMKDKSYSLDIPAIKGLIHAQFSANRWQLDLDASLAFLEREETFTTLSGKSSRSKWFNQWGVGGELGLIWEQGMMRFEPFLSTRRTVLSDDRGYDNNTLTLLTAGGRYQWKYAGPLVVMRPSIFCGYVHQWEDDLFSTGAWIPGASVYRVNGLKIPKNRILAGASIMMSMRQSMDVFGKFTSELAGGYSSYTLLAGMNWNF